MQTSTHSCNTLLPTLDNLIPHLPPSRQPPRQYRLRLLPLPLHDFLESSSQVFDRYRSPPTIELEAQTCAVDGRDSSDRMKRNGGASE